MIMKKTILILLCALSLHLSAQRVNLHYNNTPISAILKQLNSEQHNYAINFIYNDLEDFHVTTDIKNKTIPDAIRQMIGFYPIKNDKRVFAKVNNTFAIGLEYLNNI